MTGWYALWIMAVLYQACLGPASDKLLKIITHNEPYSVRLMRGLVHFNHRQPRGYKPTTALNHHHGPQESTGYAGAVHRSGTPQRWHHCLA